ncbi:MAG: glutathione S-transferase family protein [Deltaproteobacteria bacterium]|nr:glutathione S-transferase family protein [Deltaproteobacteria bacterium]
MAPPNLLHFRVSHYNEKARWALDFKGIAHTREALLPGLHIPRVRWLTGQNKVPVLELGDRVVAGSDRILLALEELHPEPALVPAEPRLRERALALEHFFDTEVAPDVRRLFWWTYLPEPDRCAEMATMGFSPTLRWLWRRAFPVLKVPFARNMGLHAESARRARERLDGHFDRLEAELGPSGYLVGERFGAADLTAAAVMTAILRPPEFPYPLPEPWPEALVALRESVAGRAGARWVRDMYVRHRGRSSEVPRG